MARTKATKIYRKNFIPLESSPDVFNNLLDYLLGDSGKLTFKDVLSLDDPNLLPKKTLALILTLPTGDKYEAQKAIEDEDLEDYQCSGNDQGMIWFKQTINNACGLYATLHALCNGAARDMISPKCLMTRLLNLCSYLSPHQQSLALEDCEELEEVYKRVAPQGSSPIPEDPEAEPEFHYVCFVRSKMDGRMYELDGDRKGPIDRGSAPDLLSPKGLQVIREYMNLEKGNVYFSLMALVAKDEADE